jgi:hypothetical protein
MFINGTQEGGSYTDANNYLTPPTAVWIGTDYLGSSSLNGFLEEYRISKVGRYSANFTPPTAAYSIDPNGSINYAYDAVNDRFSAYDSAMTFGSVTATGSHAPLAAGYTGVNRDFKLPNGNTVYKLGYYSPVATTGKLKIMNADSGVQFDVIYDLAFTHAGGGWQDFTLPTPFVLPSTGTLYLGVYYATAPGSVVPASAIAIAYKIGDITGNDQSGFTQDTAGGAQMPLRIAYDSGVQNMTLISVNYTATSTPANARVALQLADSLSLTPGTDFTMEVSRDGGTTWTAVTMSLTMPSFGGVKMYEGQASISGQPSGTSMKWRLKSLTNKAIIASGVVLQYS